MSMKTNLLGRVKHTELPKANALFPLYEAVVNSIHGIEEGGRPVNNGQITINVIRSTQMKLEFANNELPPITGFEVVDDGIGFNDKNMESFKTLDSDHKIEKGCRGVGRLMWLKAFDDIRVKSLYVPKVGEMRSRTFGFNSKSGVVDEADMPIEQADGKPVTSIKLMHWEKKYQEAAVKSGDSIADRIFEHCLWYFVRDQGCPRIALVDGGSTFDLNKVKSDHILSIAVKEEFTIKGKPFTVTHIKLRKNNSQAHSICLCAAGRLAKEEPLKGKIPGLFGKINDDEGDFIYTCFVTSPYLDKNVRSERTGFTIEEEYEGIFKDSEVSLKDIREEVIKRSEAFLSSALENNKNLGKSRVTDFVASRAPKYRPILARIPENLQVVDPEISDKELEVYLHKQLMEIESGIIAEGHDIMTPKDDEDKDTYRARLSGYLSKVEDIKKSDLAGYVSHRRVILDMLSKAIEMQGNGKYSREDIIHSMLMPMGVTSDQVSVENCNLWVIDERLAFHDYLASDTALAAMPITGSKETKEPDICCLNVLDNPILFSEQANPPFASLTIIEIKRPMRNDASAGTDKDPIEQALDYLQRIRDGKVTSAKGRPLGDPHDIPGYCYILCDITASIKLRCRFHDLTITSDGLGYFGYNKNFRSYIEVISFQRLINMATQRNRAFFDKLGLPSR